MSNPPDIRPDSEADPMPDSDVGSNERTNERTDASDTYGRLSGTGSRRERAYEKSTAITLADLLADSDKSRRPPSEQDAKTLARLLDQRRARHHRQPGGKLIAQIVDDWLDSIEMDYNRRWPVIRTGDRSPIPWLLRLSIYSRDGYACRTCSFIAGPDDREHFELDHCIPWSAGGPDDSDNLRTLCRPCNQQRSNYVDRAHETTYRATTWWCLECWSPDTARHEGRYWRDGSATLRAPYVDLEDEPELVWCAYCSMYALSNHYFVGQKGRDLLAICGPREER